MKKEMLINVLQPEECRIAILEDGVLEELYVERTSHESYVGNIYIGRIVNIEPSIQAAFVDFGVGRNGFLHVSDVEAAYYRHLEQGRPERGGRRPNGRDRHRVPAQPLEDEALREDTPGDDKREPSRQPEARRQSRSPKEKGSGRGRRRSRGGSRGRPDEGRGKRADASAEETGISPAPEGTDSGSDAGQPTQRPPQETIDREPPPPLFMESAERHTEEEGAEAADVSSELTEDDLFFPRPESSETEPAVQETTEQPTAHLDLPWTQEQDVQELPEVSDSDLGEDNLAEEMAEERVSNFDAEEAGEEEEPRRRRRPRDDRRGGGGRRPFRGHSSRMGMGRPKPLIQDIFRRGQEVLVQVIKEGIGTKGPTLSTYISIAGRYLVLMPGLNRVGVSRKIDDEEHRRRLREIFHELKPPRGLGFIIRTAGMERNKKELQGDLAYLARLWQVVVRRIRKTKAPAEIYQESDMITRTIRDTFTNDIDTIWVDEPTAFGHAQEFLQIVMPRYANRIKQYSDSEPLFHKYGIEDEIARIQQRHVPLPHGGSIVIDQTEALVAIDVNSGNFRADNNAEETAYQMNLQAAKEIARQLRLRDLGGVIVNDFIDMRDEKHRRGVERAMRDAVKRDRARTKLLKISQFGIIEMTRQRIRPSLKRSVYQDCAHCRGTGQVKTCESMSIDVMRMLQLAAHRDNVNRIQIRVADEVAAYLQNKKRKEITRLEESGAIQVQISGQMGAAPEMLEFVCYDNNNNEVKFLAYDEDRPRRR